MAKPAKKPQRGPSPVQAPHPTAATITVEEAAKRLRIGRNQAYGATLRGEIPHIRIGKRILIPTAALNRLLGETA